MARQNRCWLQHHDDQVPNGDGVAVNVRDKLAVQADSGSALIRISVRSQRAARRSHPRRSQTLSFAQRQGCVVDNTLPRKGVNSWHANHWLEPRLQR